MAKFYGNIGFAMTKEEPANSGIWIEDIEEHPYSGELIKKRVRYDRAETLNDNINLSLNVSIIADSFATENYHRIRYVVYRQVKWKVTDVELQYPRLTLTIGGLYNG